MKQNTYNFILQLFLKLSKTQYLLWIRTNKLMLSVFQSNVKLQYFKITFSDIFHPTLIHAVDQTVPTFVTNCLYLLCLLIAKKMFTNLLITYVKIFLFVTVNMLLLLSSVNPWCYCDFITKLWTFLGAYQTDYHYYFDIKK